MIKVQSAYPAKYPQARPADIKAPAIQRTAPLRPVDPTPLELAERFGDAMLRWSAAGFPVLTREEYATRADICRPCPNWDGSARYGLGKCTDPRCGCSRFKRWLRTEKCPQKKWPVLK